MYVDVGTRDVDVAAQDDLAPLVVQLLRPRRQPGQEAELGGIILAAVGHVDRSDDQVAEPGLYDPRFHVELGMAELGTGIDESFPDVKRYAGVAAMAMPEHVVVREIAAHGDLRRIRLQLLQTHHVGLVALQPLAELRLASPDAIDVPGGYLHRGPGADFASRAISR